MNNRFIRSISLAGSAWGGVGRIITPKITYIHYLFARYAISARHKKRFRSFGAQSLLAPGITLLHPEHITIGENSSIMRHCILETSPCSDSAPRMEIGNDVSLGEYTHITCTDRIVIGDGVLTGRFVLITDNSHGKTDGADTFLPPLRRTIHSNGPVIIGKNVWIGDKATILPNVTVGEGAIIAANAVVTKNIPAFAVAGGCPAKVIKVMNEQKR